MNILGLQESDIYIPHFYGLLPPVMVNQPEGRWNKFNLLKRKTFVPNYSKMLSD